MPQEGVLLLAAPRDPWYRAFRGSRPGGCLELSAGKRLVMVVEDDALLAHALVRLLRSRVAVEVCDRAQPAMSRVAQLASELAALIADVRLPDGCGLSVAEHARTLAPALPILVVTGVPSAEVSQRAFALDAPLLIKPFAPWTLDRFIRSVLGCGECEPHDAAAHAVRYLEESGAVLTAREKEVLSMAILGRNRHEIASSLGIAESTVKTLTSRLLRKTAAKSVLGLALRIWSLQLSAARKQAHTKLR